MSKSKNSKKQIEGNIDKKWLLLPLQFILIVLPLILRLYQSVSGYSAYPWHSAEDAYVDVFLHGKMVAFQLVAAITLGLVVYKVIKMEKETRKRSFLRFIPMFIYLGMVILSTVCSEHPGYAWSGAMDAKEPFGVLAGYVIVVFYAYLVIETMEDVARITGAAVIGSACMALIGILQTMGKDPLAMEAVQRLFAGNKFIDTYGPLQTSVAKGIAYGTLFNSNYVGTYVAMYAPLLLIGFVMYKQVWKKVACGLSFVGLLIMLFASQSRTGLIAVIAVAVVLLIFLSRKVWQYWYLVIPGVTFLVMSFLLIDTYRDNLLTNRLKQMFAVEVSDKDVVAVDTTENGVRVIGRDTEYMVRMLVSDGDVIYKAFEKDKGLEVSYEEDKSYAYFTLSTGEEVAIQTAMFADNYAFGLNINGRNFYFTNQLVAGNYKYINDYGRLDECIAADNAFPGYEAVASGRGYAWGRSIPLLWSNFIVGSGPDTFAVEFPQNDYVARYQSGFAHIIFTRPHNFYLQMGVQTGTISLIAFLVFYVWYFVDSCRRYFARKFERVEEWMGFALFLSSIGFIASGLANDSLIVVTPIFYVMLGAGMAINYKLCPLNRKEKAKKEEGLE